jgi:hypothetical protein
MKKNMAIVDRIIRILIVALVAVLYFTHQLSPDEKEAGAVDCANAHCEEHAPQ